MTEKEKLEQEIAYYTALIQNFRNNEKLSSAQVVQPHYAPQSRPRSSKYTYVRNGHIPPSSSTSSNKHSLVRSANLVTSKQVIATSSAPVTSKSRTVLLTGNKGTRRTVLKHSDTTCTAQQSQDIPHSFNIQRNSSKRTVVPPSSTASRQVVNDTQQNTNNKFVWVNKNVQKKQLQASTGVSTSLVRAAPCKPVQQSYRVVTKPSITKATHVPASNSQSQKHPSQSNHSLKAVGKYKLVSKNNSSSEKRTLKMKSCLPPFNTRSIDKYSRYRKGKFSPYISKSGKRTISRYKIRRRSVENFEAHSASPALKITRKRFSQYKIDRRTNATVHSRFKIDRVKGQRKPVKLVRSRKWTPKAYRWVKHELREANCSPFVSPFKLCRQVNISSERKKTNTPDRSWVVRKLASRSLQRSAVRSVRAKYQKNNTNNKHCLFYMRFGKCKRGDNCYYIHDPDRIAVCTRYLRGTCNIESCLFSHEAKKEKVPVCQHFLRGCCVRDNCPYLHVNVGKNAPICQSFAEFRYCHLGEKCKKVHTDICPNRDSEGKCPKGSKCRLRHPKRISKRKDSSKGQSSSEAAKLSSSEPADELVVVPHGEKLTDALPAFISLGVSTSIDTGEQLLGKTKKLKNKPNFL